MLDHLDMPIVFGACLPYPTTEAKPDSNTSTRPTNVDAGTAMLRRRIQNAQRSSALRRISRSIVAMLAHHRRVLPGLAYSQA